MKIIPILRQHFPDILEISENNHLDAWNEDDLIMLARTDGMIGMLVEQEDIVLGYMYYKAKAKIQIIDIAVDIYKQRLGIASFLLKDLIDQTEQDIFCYVRETNLCALNFFKSMGFKATKIKKEMFDNIDGIVMRYQR